MSISHPSEGPSEETEPTRILALSDLVTDAKNAIMIPGLIDSHIHTTAVEQLHDMAQFGITTAVDCGCWPADLNSKLRAYSQAPGVTKLLCCGVPACHPGSRPSHFERFPRDLCLGDDPDPENFVERRVKDGVDFIKVISDVEGAGLSQNVLNRIVVVAHKHGKRVIAHATNLVAFRMALMADADVLTHVPIDGLISQADLNKMAQEGKVCSPTLEVMRRMSKFFAEKGHDVQYKHAVENVQRMRKFGVPVHAGSDAFTLEGPPRVAQMDHWEGLKIELERLVDVGMSNAGALCAATELPAQYLGMIDRGTIKEGMRADLVLLKQKENPIEDIRAVREVDRVWIAGQEVCRKA